MAGVYLLLDFGVGGGSESINVNLLLSRFQTAIC